MANSFLFICYKFTLDYPDSYYNNIFFTFIDMNILWWNNKRTFKYMILSFLIVQCYAAVDDHFIDILDTFSMVLRSYFSPEDVL